MGVRYPCPKCSKELDVEDIMPLHAGNAVVGDVYCHYCEAEFEIEVEVNVYPLMPKKTGSA